MLRLYHGCIRVFNGCEWLLAVFDCSIMLAVTALRLRSSRRNCIQVVLIPINRYIDSIFVFLVDRATFFLYKN